MIQIYNGTLTSKERVLRTFNHEKADRVPIGYFANPGIQKRVAAALGVPADKDSVNDALGVDFKGLMPAYTGKPLFTVPGPERHVHPLTGAVTRWVANEDGGYWRDVFGAPDQVRGSDNDLLAVAERLAQSGGPKPKVYIWCGTEDFLYPHNTSMRDQLNRLGYDLTYEESPGDHQWKYWDEKIQTVLKWLPLKG